MRFLTVLILSIILLPLVAGAQRIPKEERRKIAEVGAVSYFKFATCKANAAEICYEKSVGVKQDKNRMYRRALQYIASQNWAQAEHIRCKDNSLISFMFFDKDITFNDEIDYVIIGNGFEKYEGMARGNMFITFKYKIAITDTGYKYTFSDFDILEFVHGPVSKGKSSAVVYGGIAGGSSKTRYNDVDVRTYHAVEYFGGVMLDDGYHMDFGEDAIKRFKAVMKATIAELKNTMTEE